MARKGVVWWADKMVEKTDAIWVDEMVVRLVACSVAKTVYWKALEMVEMTVVQLAVNLAVW